MKEMDALAAATKHLVVDAVTPILDGLDRLLRRWPWLYRRLGGTP